MLAAIRRWLGGSSVAESVSQPAEECGRWFRVICDRCGWAGLSRDCEGGEPLADTGDYGELLCPVCIHDGGTLFNGQYVAVRHIRADCEGSGADCAVSFLIQSVGDPS